MLCVVLHMRWPGDEKGWGPAKGYDGVRGNMAYERVWLSCSFFLESPEVEIAGILHTIVAIEHLRTHCVIRRERRQTTESWTERYQIRYGTVLDDEEYCMNRPWISIRIALFDNYRTSWSANDLKTRDCSAITDTKYSLGVGCSCGAVQCGLRYLAVRNGTSEQYVFLQKLHIGEKVLGCWLVQIWWEGVPSLLLASPIFFVTRVSGNTRSLSVKVNFSPWASSWFDSTAWLCRALHTVRVQGSFRCRYHTR